MAPNGLPGSFAQHPMGFGAASQMLSAMRAAATPRPPTAQGGRPPSVLQRSHPAMGGVPFGGGAMGGQMPLVQSAGGGSLTNGTSEQAAMLQVSKSHLRM